MKRSLLFSLSILSLVLVLGGTGCRKKPVGVTDIPGRTGTRGTSGGGGTGSGIDSTGGILGDDTVISEANPDGTIPLAGESRNVNGPKDRDVLAAEMVHFALDSSVIRDSEKPKLDRVAEYIKANPRDDILIEGHCDERGTEGYNLALGERRALAAREYLASQGVNVDYVYTISYGESRPIEPLGTGEAAYSKNRRCEFVVVKPAQ